MLWAILGVVGLAALVLAGGAGVVSPLPGKTGTAKGPPLGTPLPPTTKSSRRALDALGDTLVGDAGPRPASDDAPAVNAKPSPPGPPTNSAEAKRLAPLVANNVREYLGYYSRPLVAEFQAAAGLRSAKTNLPDGIYGGRTADALRHFGVAKPPRPISLPDSYEYEYPGGDTAEVR